MTQIEQDILANGKVESQELEVLRRELYVGGKIDRQKADFLVELYNRRQPRPGQPLDGRLRPL